MLKLYKMKRAIEIEYAREQRKLATAEESKMWELLRNRKFMNFKFSRQYPIVISTTQGKRIFYIADFFCQALGLILEIDGPIHEKQKSYDQARDKILNDLGYNILRLKNEQIKDKPGTILKILSDFISQLKKKNEKGNM
jgi:very-short-patch-repair endonuclease